MADLLGRIRGELDARMNELRPLLDEHDRLAAALQALGDADKMGVAAQTTGSAAATGRGRRSATRSSPAKRRTHAPRGANRQAVLDAVRDRPGASAGELAAVSGVSRNSLYALLARLVDEGELVKRDLPTGQTGYAPKP